jgi:hypothetical protein
MITHLVDYFYDHCSPTADQIAKMERVIYLQEQPSESDPLQVALYRLSQVTWSLTPNPATVRQTLNSMLSTQKQSMVQMHPHVQLSENDLAHLTVNKGHRSLCLYFSIANPEFDVEEAASLMSFGHYMQFMDDLEDFYEDRAEGRNSTVSSGSENQEKATQLLRIAESDLVRFYNNDNYDYKFVRDRVLFFHNAMLFAFRIRELTRHFPKPVQRAIQTVRDFLSLLIPFFYVAPVEYTE